MLKTSTAGEEGKCRLALRWYCVPGGARASSRKRVISGPTPKISMVVAFMVVCRGLCRSLEYRHGSMAITQIILSALMRRPRPPKGAPGVGESSTWVGA